MPILSEPLVWATTSTSGTGAFTCTGAVTADGVTYRPWSVFPNGSEVLVFRGDLAAAFEQGTCTVTTSGGVTTLTWVSRHLTSAGGTTPVNWPGGGTQNVRCTPLSSTTPVIQNGGSEYAAYAAAFRGHLGLGTASLIAASRFGLIVNDDNAQSGGTVGKFVRFSAANVWADASAADTIANLALIAFKATEGYYLPGTTIPNFTGLTAGQSYWLEVSGGAGAGVTYSGTTVNVRTTPPSTSSSQRRLWLGKALSISRLHFRDSLVVGG